MKNKGDVSNLIKKGWSVRPDRLLLPPETWALTPMGGGKSEGQTLLGKYVLYS